MPVSIPIFPLSADGPIPMMGQKSTITLKQRDLERYFMPRVNQPYEGYFVALFTVADNPYDLFHEDVVNMAFLYEKGLLCKVLSIDEVLLYEKEIWCSVCIEVGEFPVPIKNLRHNVTAIYAEYEEQDLLEIASYKKNYYPEPIEEDIKIVLSTFSTSCDKYNECAPRAIKAVVTDPNALPFQKCNAVAELVLVKSKDRLDYIQAATPAAQYVVLLKGINFYISDTSKKSLPPNSYIDLFDEPVDLTGVIQDDDAALKAKKLSFKTTKKRLKTPSSKRKKGNDPSWRERLNTSKMPEEVKEKIEREIVKIEGTPKGSTEYAQVADYLRWVFSIPWGTGDYKDVDLKQLRENLDEKHYGLDEVKEHLVELMCLQQIKQQNNGSVLCFIGPAGTGKTTIAKSIAANSNRPVIHIALGGLSDVAEFRGYRRTYIAARPGRLISEVANVKSLAPLIILDEIDKMQAVKGDPAAALLEILDPEQNSQFTDHYLEVPVDLSKAVFVCTANYENQIPAPLKDRMELIRFRSYSDKERDTITRQFVMPKAIAEYNPTDLPVSFEEDAIVEIVKIPQIRQIEKLIAKLIRRGVTQIHVYEAEDYTITKDEVLKIKNNYKEQSKRRTVGFGS